MRRLSQRAQRTLTRPAEVTGVGFLTGALVSLRFLPAPAHTGVVFIRTDLASCPEIPARYDWVTGTQRRTTLGHPPAQVGLVEHVLAALAGLHIDNCYVELDAPEPPGLDGSAQGFVEALRKAGTCVQAAWREIWCPTQSIVVSQAGASLALHPSEHAFRISYFLDYGNTSPIARQSHTQTVSPGEFSEVASCRTFVLQEEAEALRQQGLGARTTAADLLVFGPRGPIDNSLRYANEPARHKVLDLIGDLSLFGAELRGHVVAFRSGHPLNIELVRALVREATRSEGASRCAA